MDRWQQIERVFLAASELPAADRAAFVERESAGDTELRAAVEGMLWHSDDGGTRFADAVGHVAAAVTVPTPAAEIERTRIDRYVILKELGRGGMGTVYLAERADQEFQQQVAIKVVKRGMDTAQIVERFRHERRILASLDHPNIARLFDGGATSDGLPYLVMEYIEGQPLMDYCQERRLSIRERLRLFEQICAAVQHAHQKLVVHRDIKPANILVTSTGVPKLLDFGIAKIMPPDEDGGANTLTAVGMRLLTPAYASPEQLRGDPVSVGSDVYSLGVVLYELLTGARAHQFKNYTEAEFARVVCEVEATPPSEVATDVRARHELSGDLDNIVGLALRKDPARRYVSVEQFATDIRRYLSDLPVLARPETLLYRARKFASRNRVPVAAGVLVMASLLAGIIGTTIQARRADAQAEQAKRRFQQVRKLANTFVFDIYDGLDIIPGTAKLRANVVSTAMEYLDSLAKDAEGETALQLELAAAYKRIGDVQGNPSRSGFGQMGAAIASYEKAITLLQRLATTSGDERPDPKVLADLAILERTIGYMRISMGDPAAGIEHLKRSVAAWERRHPERGQDLDTDTGIAQAWGIMGQALVAQGKAAEAVARHAAAVDLLSSWLPKKTLPTTHGTISLMQYDLATALRDVGELEKSAQMYLEARRMRKQLLDKNPKNLSNRRRVAIVDMSLATLFGNPLAFSVGDAATAESYATKALQEAEAMAEEDHGSARSLRDQALANWIMGCVLLPRGTRRGVPYLEKALELTKDRHDDAFFRQVESNTQETLALILLKTGGDRRRAIGLLRSASATMESLSRQSPGMIDYRSDLVRVWNALGDALLPSGEANEFYRKAYFAAEGLPLEGQGNVWATLGRAQVDLRWPRWNPNAPAAERQNKLDAALRSWQKLAAQAPGNQYIQASLADARHLAAQR
jgi:tetratricopeptide (TPR) repeat protein/predicted Ser/Thr protein kinase